jgi:outer membrane protein
MKKIILTLIALFVISSLNAGILVDVEAGAGVWLATPTSKVNYSTGDTLDTNEQDLNLKSNQPLGYFWVNFTHFMPVIPNARIDITKVSLNGSSDITNSFQFGDIKFGDSTIDTDLKLDQIDVSLYYSFLGKLLPYIDIDVGLGIKYYDGSIKVTGKESTLNTSISEQANIKMPLPYAYGRVALTIPTTDIMVDFDLKYFEMGTLVDAQMVDARLKLDIELISLAMLSAHLEAGYRIQTLNITAEENALYDFKGKFQNDMSGVFAGAIVKFGL